MFKRLVKLWVFGIAAIIFPYQFDASLGELGLLGLVNIILGRRAGDIKRRPGLDQQINNPLLLCISSLVLAGIGKRRGDPQELTRDCSIRYRFNSKRYFHFRPR